MNSSLDVLVENFPDNDFKYLSQEFTSGMLEQVKQKGMYPYDTVLNTITVLKSFLIKNYPVDVSLIILKMMDVLLKKIIYMLVIFEIH